MIEKLYIAQDDLIGVQENSPEIKRLSDELDRILGEKYIDCEDTITDYGIAMEKQGFIKGFNMAKELLLSGRQDERVTDI